MVWLRVKRLDILSRDIDFDGPIRALAITTQTAKLRPDNRSPRTIIELNGNRGLFPRDGMRLLESAALGTLDWLDFLCFPNREGHAT
jgi:hypothetical protein